MNHAMICSDQTIELDYFGCSRKRRYTTENAAFRVILRIAKFVGPQRTYPCQHCGGWHITTMTSDITGKRIK